MKYLVFLILIFSTNFYGIILFEDLPWLNINCVLSILLVCRMLFNNNSTNYFYKDVKDLIYWSFVCVVLSSFVAIIDWEQGFMTSLVASRFIIIVLLGLFFAKFRVRKDEIIWGLKWFSYINVVLIFAGALDEGTKTALLGSWVEDPAFKGGQFLIFYMYFHFEKTYNKPNKSNIIVAVLFFAAIVIMSNRSILFSFLIIMGVYFFIYLKINFVVRISLAMFLGLILYFAIAETLELLGDQTINELTSEEYNRIKAFNYLVFEFNKDWYGKIFGNGFASSNSKYGYLINDLKAQGIFQSDMGILGLWSIYGIPLVFVLIKKLFKIVESKNLSLYLRWNGFHVFLGSLMYSFVTPEQILFWVIFFYLFCLEKKKNQQIYTKRTILVE